MEEILSSIKRIIAEEGDQPQRRARAPRPDRAMPLPSTGDPDDEVLELSEPLPSPRPAPDAAEPAGRAPEPRPTAPRPVRAPEPSQPASTPEPIVSHEVAAASRGSLEALSRLLVKPEPGSDGTLEGLVRDMLRPMLRDWLDAHLPELVEAMVAREIKRITSGAA